MTCMDALTADIEELIDADIDCEGCLVVDCPSDKRKEKGVE